MHYLRLQPNSTIARYEGMRPFAAIVVVESEVTREWQWQVSQWLVASGCLYMLAWGRDCSSWDDSVDYANLEVFNYGDIPEDQHVMTTWHDNWTLSEVFDFAKRHVRPISDNVKLKEMILLHVSTFDKRQEYEALFVAA